MPQTERHTAKKKCYSIILPFVIIGVIVGIIFSTLALPWYKKHSFIRLLEEKGFEYSALNKLDDGFVVQALSKEGDLKLSSEYPSHFQLPASLFEVELISQLALENAHIYVDLNQFVFKPDLLGSGIQQTQFINSILEIEGQGSFSLNGLSSRRSIVADSMLILSSDKESFEVHYNKIPQKEELSLFAEDLCLSNWKNNRFFADYIKGIEADVIMDSLLQAELLITKNPDSDSAIWAFIGSNSSEVKGTLLESYRVTAFSFGIYGNEEYSQKSNVVYTLQSVHSPLNPNVIVSLSSEGSLRKIHLEHFKLGEYLFSSVTYMQVKGTNTSLDYEIVGNKNLDPASLEKLREITQKLFHFSIRVNI